MKKSKKLLPIILPAGKFDEGEKYYSWSFIEIDTTNAIEVHKPTSERIMWQDPALTEWEGADARKLLKKLNDRFQWNNY